MVARWFLRALAASLAVMASASRISNSTFWNMTTMASAYPSSTTVGSGIGVGAYPAAASAAAGLGVTAAAQTCHQQACAADLDSRAGRVLADMTVADLRHKNAGAWNSPSFKDSNAGNRPHRIDDFRGDQVLKIFHPKNHGTSGQRTFRGKPVVKWNVAFSSVPRGLPGDSAVFEYQVFFQEGWTWARGGKMHGLTVGYGAASGGRRSTTGASFRVMWLADGGAIAYVYLPYKLRQDDAYYKFTGQGRKDDHTLGDGTKTEFGTGLFKKEFGRALKIGAWNTVQIGIKLNSVDANGDPRPDGVVSLGINGRTSSFDKIMWRRSSKIEVESAEFTTFAGGPDPMWQDGWQFFKSFKLRQFQ